MGTLVVMQPTFLPWAGYFNLMAQAKDFVFLDDVQLEKQSWQTRNKLLIAGQVQWIGVPVRHERMSQTIMKTLVVDSNRWRQKLARSISQNYGRHAFFHDAVEIIDLLENHPSRVLADLNEALIKLIAARLGLAPRLYRSRDLGIDGVRSERLIKLCAHFGAQEYLSPPGAAQYLGKDNFAANVSARLRFQEYVPRPYQQKGTTEFISHLSILDVVANMGWDAASRYVRLQSSESA